MVDFGRLLKYDWNIKMKSVFCPFLDPSGHTEGVCEHALNRTKVCSRKNCRLIKEPKDERCKICFYKHVKNHKEPCRGCIYNPTLSSKFQQIKNSKDFGFKVE